MMYPSSSFHDKAGERIVEDLLHPAEKRLREDASRATSCSSRTTRTPPATRTAATRTISSAATYPFQRLAEALIPFFVTRQILRGRGQGAPDRRAASTIA